MISGGIIKNFNSIGIQDQASTCQLTVLDDFVVFESTVLAKKIKTKTAEIDFAEVDNLKIKGTVEASEKFSNFLNDISTAVFNKRTIDTTLEIGNTNIESEGRLLLNRESLGPSVMLSNLRKLGLLQDLRVQGDAVFSETMIVSALNKVGINTQEPVGVLSIWDQDAELSVMKHSRKNMFLGSTRQTDLTIGTNNEAQIVIKQDEVAIQNSIRIMGIKFTVLDYIPDYPGQPNEIVLVSNAKEGQPLFYICKGSNTWAALGVKAV